MTDSQLEGAEAIAIEQSADVAPTKETTEQSTEQPLEQKEGETAAEYSAREKKLLNAMSHRDRRIGKMTAQKYETEAQLRQLQERLAKYETKDSPASTAPETAKFDNYEDYLKALAEYKVNEKFSESEKKRQTEQQQVSQHTRHAERIAHIEENDAVAREAFSDFENVFKDNEHIVMEAPDHIKQAFLEAENPAFAFYALAKEGKLESMLSMSPYQAVAMIARYEDKALALSKTKQVTKAPAPLTPSKGTSVGSKSIESLSGDDLLKWVYSKH